MTRPPPTPVTSTENRQPWVSINCPITGATTMPPSAMPSAASAIARPRYTVNQRASSTETDMVPPPSTPAATGNAISPASSHSEFD